MDGETAATPHEMTMLDWALEYARAGFRVLPVHTIRNGACSCGGMKGCKPGKHPIANLVRHGSKDATTDEATIRALWSKFQDEAPPPYSKAEAERIRSALSYISAED